MNKSEKNNLSKLNKLELRFVKEAAKTFDVCEVEAAAIITRKFIVSLSHYMTPKQYKTFVKEVTK